MAVSATASTTSDVNVSSTPAAASASDATGTADRFLKLLVAQMKNQDPLNPMDNAQVTSQMAQINTVTGIDKLNTHGAGPVDASSCRCRRCRAPRWSATTSIVAGNKLERRRRRRRPGRLRARQRRPTRSRSRSSTPSGAGRATRSTSAPQSAGMHSFDWPPGTATSGSGLTFRVTATSGGVSDRPRPR